MSEEEVKAQPRKKAKGAKKGQTESSQKSAETPLTGEEGIIYTYMMEQNRPYSFQNIFDNLRGQVKKTSGQKAADKLVTDGKLQSKDFGKARVYIVNQASLPIPDQSKLEQLEEEIKEKSTILNELKQEVKGMQQTLKELATEMTDEQLSAAITKLKTDLLVKREKMEKIQAGEVPVVSESERLQAENKLQICVTFANKRKKLVKDMLNTLADSFELKMSDLRTKLGLD